jgi:hypothetical protein
MIKRYLDTFSEDLAKRAWEYASTSSHWTYGGASSPNPSTYLWKADLNGTLIAEEMWGVLAPVFGFDYILKDVAANGQTAMQQGDFHTDSADGITHSFVWFANPDWKHGFGGSLIICGENKLDEWSIPAIPNSGVLFDANLLHRADTPCVLRELRVSIAFKLMKVK